MTGVTPALSSSCRTAVETAIAIAHAADVKITLDINLRRKLWDDDTARAVLLEAIERSAANRSEWTEV